MLGIEPRALEFSPKTLRPPILVEDNRSTSAHLNWSGSRDLHPDRLLHRERCCYYTTILI